MNTAEAKPSDQDSKLIQKIFQTWFADESSDRLDVPQPKRWFNGGASFDKQLSEHYAHIVKQMQAGEFDHWRNSADGALASILVLDQFNRNIHRGTSSAFSGDARALALSEFSIERGYPAQFPIPQRVFFYMPLMHSESLRSHQKLKGLLQELAQSTPPELAKFTQGTMSSAKEHQDIIEQFGRYPYRNLVLERSSTPEELTWLAQKNKRFGQ